jgi:hypothetical protein
VAAHPDSTSFLGWVALTFLVVLLSGYRWTLPSQDLSTKPKLIPPEPRECLRIVLHPTDRRSRAPCTRPGTDLFGSPCPSHLHARVSPARVAPKRNPGGSECVQAPSCSRAAGVGSSSSFRSWPSS